MLLKTTQLPHFARKAGQILNARPGDLFGSLTLEEASIFLKGMLWEAQIELQETRERAPLFFTRLQSIDIMGISPQKFDLLVKSGIIKKQYLGKRQVYTQESLSGAILNEKKSYHAKD